MERSDKEFAVAANVDSPLFIPLNVNKAKPLMNKLLQYYLPIKSYCKITCLFLSFALNTLAFCQITNNKFISVSNGKFWLQGKPYFFVGTNFWSALPLANDTIKNNRKRLLQELDSLQSIGVNNIRIFALYEGPDTEPYRIIPANNYVGLVTESSCKGLDFLLSEMKKRKQYAVICLSNFWSWSGGFCQYLKWANAIDHIPYTATDNSKWNEYMATAALFYNNSKANNIFKKAISQIILRTNSITKKAYKDDETIMAWELCNEPRGMQNKDGYTKWINDASAFIKNLDSNHLITTGSEGNTQEEAYNNNQFDEVHAYKNIDYAVIHVWPVNWGWYNCNRHDSTIATTKQKTKDYIYNHAMVCKKLNKPLVVEEFGFGRDLCSYNSNFTTHYRDDFYEFVFKEVYDLCYGGFVGGANFWAWAGNGKPKVCGSQWRNGDDFTGDPPGELQGWNGVYNTDKTTKDIIKKWAVKFAQITQHIKN